MTSIFVKDIWRYGIFPFLQPMHKLYILSLRLVCKDLKKIVDIIDEALWIDDGKYDCELISRDCHGINKRLQIMYIILIEKIWITYDSKIKKLKQYQRSTDENMEGLIGQKILPDTEIVILKKKLEQKNLETIKLKERILIKERANILVIIIEKLRSYGFLEEYSIQRIIDSKKFCKEKNVLESFRIDYLACKSFNFSHSDIINIPVDRRLQSIFKLSPRMKRINIIIIGVSDEKICCRQYGYTSIPSIPIQCKCGIDEYTFKKSGTTEFLTHGKFLL